MKFAVAVVVLAFAVAVQSSAIPWGWAGHAGLVGAHDDGSWHGDNHWDDGSWDDGHWDASHDLVSSGHIGAHGWGHPAAVVAGHGYGLGLVAGHGLIAGHGLHAGHGPALVHGHNVVANHLVHGVHGVPVLDHHHHQANYVAANRGSVHVAPLAGHIQSVSSSNLSPAPGTNW